MSLECGWEVRCDGGEVIMNAPLAGALVKLTVGGLGMDTFFIEGDPVLELIGGFLAVEECLHCWIEPPCAGYRRAQPT
jgi:hypothetical protein